MVDSHSRNQFLDEARLAVNRTANAALRRVVLTMCCLGVGSASAVGLVGSLMSQPVRNDAVENLAADSVKSVSAVPEFPQFKRVPVASKPIANRTSTVVQAAYQFEPAADYQPQSSALSSAQSHSSQSHLPQTSSPQIPVWAAQLPQSNRAGSNNPPAFEPVKSPQTSVPRMADRTAIAPQLSAGSPAKDGAKFSFTFKSAPWSDVVRQFATRAGFQLRMESVPTGTFNLYDTHQYSPVEALDLINGYLIRNGHLLVRNGQTLTLISTQKGIPRNLVPAVSMNQLDQYGKNEVVAVPMPVPGSITDISKTLKPLLGQMGTAIPIPGTRQMLVTDTTAGIRRLQSVLADQRPTTSPFGRVYQLRNSSAKEIAKALNELFGNSPATAASPTAPAVVARNPRVIIVPESQTNSLLINASVEMMPQIHQIIGQLDRAPQQVVIQALLVEVDLGNVHEVGVEVGVQDSVLFDRSVVDNLVTLTETVSNPANGIQTTTERIISQTAAPGFNFNGQSLGNNTAINPATVGGQALSNLGVGRVNGDLGFGGLVLSAGSDSINVLLRALQANYQTDVLSAPQVQTTNHHPGQIQIGQLVPVVEGVALTPLGSANPVIRQDKAGLILDVTPHIHADGSVLIDVMAEKSQFRTDQTNSPVLFFDATNGNAIRAPIKDITNAKTQVSIRSGQTIVLGGMITKDMEVVERKVPILGNIPILGQAFRYDLDQTRRKELLIFLTPRVVRSEADTEAIKNEAIGRHHFPLESAWEVFGPLSDQYSGESTPGSINDEGANFEFPGYGEQHYKGHMIDADAFIAPMADLPTTSLPKSPQVQPQPTVNPGMVTPPVPQPQPDSYYGDLIRPTAKPKTGFRSLTR